jgi:hypothetical protein
VYTTKLIRLISKVLVGFKSSILQPEEVNQTQKLRRPVRCSTKTPFIGEERDMEKGNHQRLGPHEMVFDPAGLSRTIFFFSLLAIVVLY